MSGTNAAGRSHYARIEPADEVDYAAIGRAPAEQTGVQTWRMWQSDRLPDLLPTDGSTPPLATPVDAAGTPEALRTAPLTPAPLGYVATVSKIAPGDAPGAFHRHDSMDAIFVMAGELEYLLDGGDRITLQPGDVLIQNGANHAWHNRGSVPAVLGAVSFGAAWFGPPPPEGVSRDRA